MEKAMSIPSLETILDRDLAEKIIGRSVEVFPQDGILFRQGDWGDSLYIVKSGEVALKIKAGDKEVHIRAGQGSLLGLPAIIRNETYTMTAKARWGAEIFRLSSDAFNNLIDTEPRMQQAALGVFAGEVRTVRQALSDLALGSEVQSAPSVKD